MQVFYTCHILGFIGFMAFAFMHYQGMWYYTFPGKTLWMGLASGIWLYLYSLILLQSAFAAYMKGLQSVAASSGITTNYVLLVLQCRLKQLVDRPCCCALCVSLSVLAMPHFSLLCLFPASMWFQDFQIKEGHRLIV